MLDVDSHTFLTQTAYSVSEGSTQDTWVQITVRCSYLTYERSLSASYSITPITAHEGEGNDYLGTTGSVTLTGNMGYTATQTFSIRILRDIEVEGDETFGVSLTSVSEGELGRGLPGDPYTDAIVTITDNPPSVGVTLISNGSEVKAPATPHPIVVGVSCSGGDMSEPLTVSLHLRPMSESIAQADAGDLSFSQVTFLVLENQSRETYKVIEIPVMDDNDPEWLETALIEAVPADDCLPGACAYATITDNDAGLLYQNLPEETEPTPNEIDPGGYVALNLDDDNGNGIADYLDGQQPSGASSDDDLQPVAVDLPATHPGEVAQVTFSVGQNNKLRLWLDMAKTQPVSTSPYDWDDKPSTIYIEGIASGESGIAVTAHYGSYDYPGHILWEMPAIGDTVTITTMALTASLGIPVFAHNAQNPQALQCMEQTDLRWAVTIGGVPSGATAQVTLLLEDGTGASTTTGNGTVNLVGYFGNVPDGDADHHYTGIARAEITVNGITVHSGPVNTEVWELWITQFDGGKPWKVCVGDDRDISYAAVGSPDLSRWRWTMPDGKWHLTAKGLYPEAFGASGTAYIPYSDEANATNSDFGDAHGRVLVTAIDANGCCYYFLSTEDAGLKAKVFFDPALSVSGEAAINGRTPAWYVFWTQAGAGDSSVTYSEVAGRGETVYLNGQVISCSVGPLARMPSCLGGLSALNTGVTLDGGAISGIDTFHITVKHEQQHRSDFASYTPSLPDTDGDYVIDALEVAGSQYYWQLMQTSATLENTWLASCPSDCNDLEFRAYWKEVYIWAGDVGRYDSVDWSLGGKQW